MSLVAFVDFLKRGFANREPVEPTPPRGNETLEMTGLADLREVAASLDFARDRGDRDIRIAALTVAALELKADERWARELASEFRAVR